MKSAQEKILYVGKAKNLRSRVRSYFTDSKDHSPKTKLLVRHIAKVDYILTGTEVEAFLLEASLIKKHRPRYNIRLKDDKAYPYIRVSMSDRFPRLYLARKV
ncbi:MAG: GIY-YIG nuclease family protein, partial [Bdellovibrionota bacterium]